jgi:hypothetical protein
MHQGYRHHTVVAYDYAGLHLDGRRAFQRNAAQVRNERGLLGRVTRAQGPGGDQVGPRRGPHAHITSMLIGAVTVVQRSQGDKQARLLAHIRALRRWHSDLSTLFYLGAWGPERLMRDIMEHAWGWCK